MRKSICLKRQVVLAGACGSAIFSMLGSSAIAADGLFNNQFNTTSSYSDTTNWTGGIVANGIDATATLDLANQIPSSSLTTVNIDQNVTLGTLLVTNSGTVGKNLQLKGTGGSTISSRPVISFQTSTGMPKIVFSSSATTFVPQIIFSGTPSSGNGWILATTQGLYLDLGSGGAMSVQSSTSPFVSGYFSGPLVIGRGTFTNTFTSGGGVPVTHLNVGDTANPSYTAVFSMAGSVVIAGLDGTSNGWLYDSASGVTNSAQIYSTITFGTNDEAGTFAGTVGRAPNDGASQYKSDLNLIKNGLGTQRFSGAMYHSGTTTVNAGALLVDGTHTAVINSGFSSYAALTTGTGGQYIVSGTLGGTGTITPFDTVGTTTAMIDVLSGGSISPGDNGIGTVTLNSNNSTSSLLKFESGATLNFDLGAGLASDAISIVNAQSNDVTFSGNIVNFNALSTLTGGSYTLFTADTANAFAGLSNTAGTITSGLSISPTFLAAHPGSSLQLASNNILLNIASGPANLTWNGNGTTWDTTSSNWNNASGVTTFSNGTAGAGDNVSFTDNNNGHYSITVVGSVTPSSTVFSNSAGNYNVVGSNSSSGISGAGGLNKLGSAAVTLSLANNYSGATNVSGGSLVLSAVGALPAGTNLNVAPGASVVASNLGSATSLRVGTLSLAGKLNLNNNLLIVRNSDPNRLASVNALLASGYAGGTWNGSSGIISSTASTNPQHLTALGVILNDNGSGVPLYGAGGTIAAALDGATPAAGDVLVKYTYYGDSNLDGKVDGTDYSRIDSGFLSHATGWASGDFNYDGLVNGSDYTLIDNAFNTQGASLLASIAAPTAATASQIAGSSTSAVPEPGACVSMAIAAASLLGRRRRAGRSTISSITQSL